MKSLSTSSNLARYSSYTVAVIMVLLPFHTFFTTWLASSTGHFDLVRIWKEILISLLIIPATILIARTPDLRKFLRDSLIVRLAAVYFLLHLAMGYWALSTNKVNASALIYALLSNLRYLGFFLICLVLANKHNFLYRNWKRILSIPALVVIVFGLLQIFVLPIDFLRHFGYGPKTIPPYELVDPSVGYQRIQSTLRGPNPLGAYFVLTLPALYFYFSGRNRLRLVSLLAGTVALAFTYSRSAWLGLVITASAVILWKVPKKLRQLFVVGGIAIALLFGATVYLLRTNVTTQNAIFHIGKTSKSQTSSNSVRANSIEIAAKDVFHHPLGGGPGSAGPASFRNNHPPKIAENYYLQIAQEVGVLGAVIFIAINYLVAVELWKRRANLLASLLLASLAGISFINLLSHAWSDDTLSLLWWGLAGITLAPGILSTRINYDKKRTKKT